MKSNNFFLFILGIIVFFCACRNEKPSHSLPVSTNTISIAFGSCGNQDKPQPMLDIAAALNPDAFVYLGDNIYGDSRTMDTLRAKYNRLGSRAEFQNLKKTTDLYAVWDDHDYGENDAGRHYPFRAESKEIFMDFWEVPEDSDRRKHEGIYGVEYLQNKNLNVQLILLDNRTFRDDLIHREKTDTINGHKNDYIPNNSPDSTLLGKEQWTWLESVLGDPADVRIIASSNQFSHEYNGWESWTNVPHEQQKMIDLIAKTKANGVIFISGDVHWGEISKLDVKTGYPIYDVTSSGITETWDVIEGNKNRIGQVIPQNNIGNILIHKTGDEVDIELSLIDSTANRVVYHKVSKDDLLLNQ